MKSTLSIILFTVAFLMSGCNSNNNDAENNISDSEQISVERTKSPEELRAELLELEQLSPTDYLSADGTYRETLFGDKLKISCRITNSATMATFKDAVVSVTYYSKTKTVLGKIKYTVYEIFPPNSTKEVELKIDKLNNVNTIGWDVISALVD